MAGINAVRQVRGEEPLILDRSQAYIGVLIDDLVTRGTKEPYRLFTSRAEYRLLLREDNADLRLSEIGRRIGLVNDATWQSFLRKKEEIEQTVVRLAAKRIHPTARVNEVLLQLGSTALKQSLTLAELLRRPEINLAALTSLVAKAELTLKLNLENLPFSDEIELQVKYDGYIRRQEEQVARFRKLEQTLLPSDLSYDGLPGLSNEVVEKLNSVQPLSLGQASRISGMTPAAISVLQVHLKKIGCL